MSVDRISESEAEIRALHDAYVSWQKNPRNRDECPIRSPGWNYVGTLLREVERLRQRVMLDEIKEK